MGQNGLECLMHSKGMLNRCITIAFVIAWVSCAGSTVILYFQAGHFIFLSLQVVSCMSHFFHISSNYSLQPNMLLLT